MADLPQPTDRLPRMIELQPLDPESGSKGQEHKQRRQGVALRRRYYEGTQYVSENAVRAEKLAREDRSFDGKWQRLPEHHRIHTYSQHAYEAVNFLGDQITGQMTIRSRRDDDDNELNPEVVTWVDECMIRSGLQYRRQEIARETMIAGDLGVQCVIARHPDDDQPQQVWHLWEAETIEFDYDEDDWMKLVEVRTEEKVHRENEDGTIAEVRQVTRWSLEPVFILDPDGDAPDLITDPSLFGDEFVESDLAEAMECVKVTEEDGDEVDRERLGIPFIPWVHIHGENQSLRSMYGRPLITFHVMESVDRYNATAQLMFLAIRYNSFGNLVVVGDEAYLREKASQDGGAYTIHKDIADALVFPGATDVESITLSINVEAYESHLKMIDLSLYRLFGLEKLDPEQLQFGGVSGYALEILNRKTDGTFRRITENLHDGVERMIDMGLRVDAIARAPVTDSGVRQWWRAEVDDVWPDREVVITFGSAYIVDEVAVRDDFTADLISRREALRQRGYTDTEIDKILAEMEAQHQEEGVNMVGAIRQGSRFSTDRE